MEKLISQIREMLIKDIQVVIDGINGWGITAGNEIVEAPDGLLPDNKPDLPAADDEASMLRLRGGDIRRSRRTKKLTEKGVGYSISCHYRKKGGFL